MRKLKFYLIGLIPGLLFVFFILNQKGVSCSGYLPDSRVAAETLTKDFQYSANFQNAMAANGITEKILKDSILTTGSIIFDRSHAQKQPCPDYILVYPKDHPKYEIGFEKCKETATFTSFKKLK